MSIINDALKKTQLSCDLGKKNKITDPTPNKKDLLLLVFSTIIGTGFVGCFIILLLLIWPKNPPPPILSNIDQPSERIENPILRLNGIIKNDQEQMALINSKILREGDEINGKKISEISNNHVKLIDGESVIILEIQK